ncbi:hypothetical protein FRZ44_38060 [Hypericibacter terrae]|uniref:PhiE125 gp8 family phage protein n=1 Tax=Hypericibacter terrae TaxID=2602015 RepID=A0A5J6MMA9_9PROT|nr:phage head-tail connector protein [Hypericibacter terrae]QEX18499.1 hypothetical protein FRZ44_38060 [Hypericibacter terrae]
MGLTLITAATVPVLDTAAAKAHLRVEFADDDVTIDALVAAATETIEGMTGRAFLQQTWRLTLDAFPACRDPVIRLPRPPLISVDSVKYVDADGTLQTLDPALYQVDANSTPARLAPAYGQVWPCARCELGAVRIEYKAGYGTTADKVRPTLVSAVKLQLGHLYENREAVNIGNIVTTMPIGVESLVYLNKVW